MASLFLPPPTALNDFLLLLKITYTHDFWVSTNFFDVLETPALSEILGLQLIFFDVFCGNPNPYWNFMIATKIVLIFLLIP